MCYCYAIHLKRIFQNSLLQEVGSDTQQLKLETRSACEVLVGECPGITCLEYRKNKCSNRYPELLLERSSLPWESASWPALARETVNLHMKGTVVEFIYLLTLHFSRQFIFLKKINALNHMG